MLNLLLFIIIGVGITNLVVNASIFDWPREFIIETCKKSDYFSWMEKLLTCMMCSGFWIGFLMTLDSSFDLSNPIYGGAIISIFSYIIGSLMDNLDLSIALKGDELEVE